VRRALSGGTIGRVALAVVLLGVLVVMVLRPGGRDEGSDPAGAPPSPTAVMPTATPDAPPNEEHFCTEYRSLAAAQGQYAAEPDATGARLLRDAADRLLAAGVPESMAAPAQAGYLTEISGSYGSLGETLDPAAVPGARAGPSLDASARFSSWLSIFCPAG
jgi:hypothetical protein